MANQLTICNIGISLVGGNRIDSIDDTDQTEAILCKDNYDNVIESVLEQAEWSFASKRVCLSPLTSTPSFQYSYQFKVPSDCLRVLEVCEQEDMSDDLTWEREGQLILCEASTVYVRYTQRVMDPLRWSPNFVKAAAFEMGARLAVPIARSKELRKSLEDAAKEISDIAANREAMQGSRNFTYKNFKLINAR